MRYILKNIIVMIKNKRIFFMFLVLVQIVSINLFIYCYGMIQDKAMRNDVNYDAQCQFSMKFLKQDRASGEYLYDDMYQFKDIRNKIDLLKEDMGDEISYLRLYLMEREESLSENSSPVMPMCCYVLNKEAYKLLDEAGGMLFTWNENCNGADRIIVNSEMALDNVTENKSQGETFVEFSGKKYKIERNKIAAGMQMAYGDIPENAMIAAMDIYFLTPPENAKSQKMILNKLHGWFGINEQEIRLPYKFDDLMSLNYFILTIGINICVCVIITMNSLMIYQYMLEERKKWISVMYLNGWSLKRLLFYIFVEMMFVMTMCALISVFIYSTITFHVIAKKQLLGEVVYQSRLYLYSWIAYFAIMMIGCFSCACRIIARCRKKLILYLEERNVWES